MINLPANRADKKFVTPIPIKQWVVIIYETRRRFGEDRAEKMVQDFVSACATVGMAVYDKNPIIKWEQGQGDIGAVRIIVPLNFRHLNFL